MLKEKENRGKRLKGKLLQAWRPEPENPSLGLEASLPSPWALTQELWDWTLELVYPTPAVCPLCGQSQASLRFCSACLEAEAGLAASPGQCNRCGTCGRHGVYCPTCYSWPQGYIKNTALFAYEGEAEDMVEKLKFDYSGWLARPAAQGIYNKLLENPALIRDIVGRPVRGQRQRQLSIPTRAKLLPSSAFGGAHQPHSATIIIPVPMSKKRLREKGYNQAALLARQMSVFLACPLEEDLLLRSRHTPHQTGLKRAQRQINLKNAFTIPPERVKEIKDKRILLVDDVLTTSSTLQECAKLLLDQGAEKIYSVTIGAGHMPLRWRQPGRRHSEEIFPQNPQFPQPSVKQNVASPSFERRIDYGS